jgi:hypothetical protein
MRLGSVCGVVCAGGVVCDKCGCPEEMCGCALLEKAEHLCIPQAFTTLIEA